jgi:hypothetical protein
VHSDLRLRLNSTVKGTFVSWESIMLASPQALSIVLAWRGGLGADRSFLASERLR